MVTDIPEVLTKQTIFSLCRKLVGHLAVYGWIRTAVDVIKCKVNVVTSGWDDQVSNALLIRMIAESIE